MIQLIIGEKGKGKTKVLLDKVNEEILSATGNVVFIDKTSKHMYELNNKVRLIDLSSYDVQNADEFTGFVLGILSQDHDLEKMYFDNFLVLSGASDVDAILNRMEKISNSYKVDFIMSMSILEENLPADWKGSVIASL